MITGILILLFVKQYSQIQWIRSCLLLYPRSPKGEGGILFYLCLSVRPSFRPSKIFFVTFFSVTVDGRNLVFGHNHHIGIPYRGKRFGPVRFLLPVCWFCWFLYTFNIHLYMHIFRSIFLSNYWWQRSDIWSQASYRYPISWEAFFEPSDSYVLFAEEQGYHKWALAHSSSCLIFRSVFRCWEKQCDWLLFLAHLAKGNVSFCHHLASVVC